jgi:hypothetical protein
MTDIGEAEGLPNLTITEGGVTVTVAPVGWLDLVAIPGEFDRLLVLPSQTAAESAALGDAMVAFAARIDAYARGPVPPSRIPAAYMRRFLDRWMTGVRDAARPPASAAGSPRRASRSPRASRRTSPPKSS